MNKLTAQEKNDNIVLKGMCRHRDNPELGEILKCDFGSVCQKE